MGNFECLYFKTGSGRSPVEIFINRLDFKTQRKFFVKIAWLQEYGPRLSAPHAKKVDDDIYEFRFLSEEGAIRILYFFYKNKIILLNGFKKKTNKIPKRDLETAKTRKEEFLNRER
ncbi:type II toxin-antitoxin system RelE/ParE family toxin [Candidatus Omnitrophota bacterium]